MRPVQDTMMNASMDLVADVLSSVQAFAAARGLRMYVVGGLIRDALIRRTRAIPNVDLAIPAHALATAHALAQALRGTYICLDEDTGCARVVVSSGGRRVELDLADFRGPTLADDLAKRDFTVNAMAVPLEAWGPGTSWTPAIIDPLGGQADLSAKRIRACFAGTFADDPVRILRAFRFAAALGCTPETGMSTMIAPAVAGLAKVAGERIRDELLAIFETDRAGWVCAHLNELGVLDVLFPELKAGRGLSQGGYHHLDVLGHQLETVAQCDRMMADFAEFAEELRRPMAEYCQGMLVEGRSRRALIKLAGLFHDVGKPGTRRVQTDGEIWFLGHEHFGAALVETVVERLRLSKREGEMVCRLVLFHLRPGHLSREVQLTRRAIFRFFRDLEEDGPACLLVWWADRLSTRGPSSRVDQIDEQRLRLEELLRAYFLKQEEAVKPRRLLGGHALMQALGLEPGPEVGRLLRAIEEAQAEGRIASIEEAIALAQSLLHEHDTS